MKPKFFFNNNKKGFLKFLAQIIVNPCCQSREKRRGELFPVKMNGNGVFGYL